RKKTSLNSDVYPDVNDIDRDLGLLENKVYAIRTYTLSDEGDKIPSIAARHHLNVALGAWLGSDQEKNRQEIDRLKQTLHNNPQNIVRVIIGNETLQRKDLSVATVNRLYS
ncbi:MAG: hypothetical protein LRY43_01515, partial [Gammaproteobacteria bacterium]|nr:hypothetical protein [Gammaproteobacteria bacterium]